MKWMRNVYLAVEHIFIEWNNCLPLKEKHIAFLFTGMTESEFWKGEYIWKNSHVQ